jgi:MYXO-CTERM domain-containing protein
MYEKLFCYEGSTTCTQWYKMERPSVLLEGGHVTHVTWAVADVDKDYQIPAGSNHGSKVIVVPFDGVAFDNDYGVGGGNAGAGGADAGTDGGSGGSGAEGGRGGSLSGGAQGIATGGSPGAGGATGTGGGIAVGGVSGSGATGSGAGGTTGFGGVTSPSGGTNPTTGPGDSNGSSSGCSCRIQEHEPARPHAGLLLLGWALLLVVRRRGSENCRG